MVMVGDSPQTSRTSTTGNAGEQTGALVLADLGALTFNGPDAASFLQGYLTIDMDALGREPAFTAMCNIKGRAVLTGYAWRDDERVMLVVHHSLCALTLDFLRPYLAFSKTQASDATGDCTIIGAMGLGLEAPARNLDGRRQLLVAEGKRGDEAQRILAASPRLGIGQWRSAAVAQREAWLEAATSAAFLPQMLALDELGAVSFTKGCYLGQEVVARAQHRGEVKRRLTRLNWSGGEPRIGAEAHDPNGRAVGIVVAVAASEDGGLALAVLGRDAAGPFSAGGGATVLRTIGAQ